MHREKENSSVHGLLVLFRKELADHLRSTRFLLMTALLTLTSMASLYGALSNIRDQATENSEFIFLSLFTTSGNSLPSICTFLAFLGPLAGIVLGFDCVNRERSLGTLNRLTAQPIYRDTVINGKFMAGFAAIFLMVFSLGILVSAIGLLVIGIAPQTEEVLRILAFLLFTVFYIAFWLGLSILFSVIWRHAATAALAGISIWIFLSFFMSMIAGAVADIAYPTEGIEGLFNLKSNSLLSVWGSGVYHFESEYQEYRNRHQFPAFRSHSGISALRTEPAAGMAASGVYGGADYGVLCPVLYMLYEAGNQGIERMPPN